MKNSERINRCWGRRLAALTLAFGLAGTILLLGSSRLAARPPMPKNINVPRPPAATKMNSTPHPKQMPSISSKPSTGGPSHPVASTPKDSPKGNNNGKLAGGNAKPKPPPVPKPPVTPRPGGFPPSPRPGAGGQKTKPIVVKLPQIGIKEFEHPRRHWPHHHDPFLNPGPGSGNSFSADGTSTATIENSGNTTIDNSKPSPTTSTDLAKNTPKPESKDNKSDETDATNGKEKNEVDNGALDEADGLFNAARASFKQGDYDKALAQVNSAIEKRPNTAALHEFKALCYFAQRKYKEAAPVLYAVIAAGPGWDMDTVKSFYPNQDTYVKQLDALKSFVEQEPDKGYGHFVLAYHYLTRGSTMMAKKQLQEVVRTQPDDKLSAALLKVL